VSSVERLRGGGSDYTVSAAEVALPAGSSSARTLNVYRRWLGLDPHPARSGKAGRVARSLKVKKADIDPDKAVQMVVLSFKERSVRCRLAGSEREITFRLMDCFPGPISITGPFFVPFTATVCVFGAWSTGTRPYRYLTGFCGSVLQITWELAFSSNRFKQGKNGKMICEAEAERSIRSVACPNE
jgi:hypothetical protein